MTSSLEQRWREQLDALHEQGRYRQLRSPRGHDFSSNDYLGYGANNPLPTEPLPVSGLASRLLRGHLDLWDEVESALADWHHCEASLVFPSGYSANEGLLSTLIEPGDWVASDQLNHASIIDGLKLSRADRYVYRHNDLNQLEEGLNQSHSGAKFIVTESLFGMEGDRAPLTEIVGLAEKHGAHVIVDEAHATGCLGPEGSGLVDQFGLRSRVLATMHTGGKGLGVMGAYITTSRLVKEILVNRCRHMIFTTALPPVAARWWLARLPQVRGDDPARNRLLENAKLFRRSCSPLAPREVSIVPGAITNFLTAQCPPLAEREGYIIPILLGEDAIAVALADKLQAVGFDVRAIRPPTVPPGTARLRVSIHADQDPRLIEALAKLIVTGVGPC